MPSTAHHTPSVRSSQVPLDADLWATEVVPHLPPELDVQARTLGALIRHRGFAQASDLLRGLLAYVLVASSFQHLGAWGVLAGVASLSGPAWHKRLVASRTWLAWLLAELLAVDPPAPSLRLVRHPHGNVLLVDATTLGQPGGTGDDWRLHTAYNFSVGRLVQVTLTDRKGGEHLGHYTIQPGDIVIADNGYGYRKSVATVRKQQAHLITRIRPSTFPFSLATGQTLDVVVQLRKRGPTVREWQGWCIEVVFKRMKSILGLGELRGHTRDALEAAICALLVAWLLQATEAAALRQRLRMLAPATQWVMSSWSVVALSVDVLKQQVRGSWGAQRVETCLPQLQRYLTSRVREDRTHQETTVRAWLERRSSCRPLVLREAA